MGAISHDFTDDGVQQTFPQSRPNIQRCRLQLESTSGIFLRLSTPNLETEMTPGKIRSTTYCKKLNSDMEVPYNRPIFPAMAAIFFALLLLYRGIFWIGSVLLQLVIPLLILGQIHWVAQELYIHQGSHEDSLSQSASS